MVESDRDLFQSDRESVMLPACVLVKDLAPFSKAVFDNESEFSTPINKGNPENRSCDFQSSLEDSIADPEVLVVNENSFNTFAVQSLMEQEGVKSEASKSGKAAVDVILQRIKDKNSLFKFIVLD